MTADPVDVCTTSPRVLVRGQLLHFLDDPGANDACPGCAYFEDGGLLIESGRVKDCGPWEALSASLTPATRLFDYRGKLILPGLVDTHLHYPQAGIMAAFGRRLLDWLNDYTYPAERAFADPDLATPCAEHVVRQLLANGTTTASVFATVHAHSADAFFEVARRHRLRMLCGKVLMDRHCPEALQESVSDAERNTRDLIERWHGLDRLRYSLTPRFAPASSPALLELTGALFNAWPTLHLQSHLAETREELAWVRQLFPDRAGYLDVYDHYGLLAERSLFAHCIHLTPDEWQRMAETGAAAAFCPSSNLFLGSGFFDLGSARATGLQVGLATDIGAGTSFGLIQTLSDAYKVSQFTDTPLTPLRAWYLATLGGARALALDDFIGNFLPGKEADFVVLDLAAHDTLAWRCERAATLAERLFALMMLGDERCVVATHVLGEAAFVRAHG